MPPTTIQDVAEEVSRAWQELSSGNSWDAATQSGEYTRGMMFAYSHCLSLLYQLEGVDAREAESPS